MTKSQLIIKNISKKYKSRTVVNNISLSINQGEIVGLLGPNGAGKTTCFYMILGIIGSDSGTILLNDQDITAKPVHARAKLGIGYLPQEPSVFKKLTVKNNILAVLQARKNLTKQQQLKISDQLLEEFNLQHVVSTYGMSLSGGERRRLEIARAIATEPSFILLDEPFAGVDPISIIDIKNIIKYVAKRNIGVIMTDHNVRETLDICERAHIMNEGHLLCSGKPCEILQNEQVRDVYLGKEFQI